MEAQFKDTLNDIVAKDLASHTQSGLTANIVRQLKNSRDNVPDFPQLSDYQLNQIAVELETPVKMYMYKAESQAQQIAELKDLEVAK